ncbi:MAG: TRL domain-containing protein [Syntrophales bacterium]
MAIRLLALYVLCIPVLTGCGTFGIIYSSTVVPYSEEFKETPVGTKRCVINDYQLSEPLTRVSLATEWSTNYISAAAEKAGIKDVYYIDVKTVSILLGIYKHKTLIIYGD